MNKFALVTLSAVVLTLAACSGSGRKTGDSGSSDSSGAYGNAGAGGASGTGAGSASDAGGAGAKVPAGRVVFFDLDSSELKPEGQALVQGWAAYLSANPSAKLRLEGHGDERGSREYNISLGERRGNAVLSGLTSQGVSARQLSVTSYGEERPVDLGHGEAAWAKNRRVEFIP